MPSASVLIRCTSLTGSITIPAAVSACLPVSSSGATRIETRFIRSGFAAPPVGEPVTMLAGHALIGVTTP
jgi:hypothetical protein